MLIDTGTGGVFIDPDYVRLMYVNNSGVLIIETPSKDFAVRTDDPYGALKKIGEEVCRLRAHRRAIPNSGGASVQDGKDSDKGMAGPNGAMA